MLLVTGRMPKRLTAKLRVVCREWLGGRSHNQGAGLANDLQLASWLKVAMPLHEADLTAQDALDVAAFVNSHERPPFRMEDHLLPQAQTDRESKSK